MPRHYADKELYERGLLIPSCSNCKYHDGFHRCAAFPAGIPWEIKTGQFDHTKPYPHDGGIRYEPRSEGKGRRR